MTATITVNIANPDSEDKDAMRLVINEDNQRRLANSQPVLPAGTAAQLKSSYETVRAMQLTTIHAADIVRASTVDGLRSNGLSDNQINQLAKAAADRLNAGESFNSILTDIQTP